MKPVSGAGGTRRILAAEADAGGPRLRCWAASGLTRLVTSLSVGEAERRHCGSLTACGGS